jgi:hypothetical protein
MSILPEHASSLAWILPAIFVSLMILTAFTVLLLRTLPGRQRSFEASIDGPIRVRLQWRSGDVE